MRHPNHIAVCALEVRSGDELIRLIPAGEFDAQRGALSGAGPWRLSAAGAARIIAAVAARPVDIPIDYEHQILLSANNGQPAPAAGWIDRHSLTWRDDGLYGRVRWTGRAAAAIAADEYRYLSPVFPYHPVTGEVLDLLHVALTNTPAIDTLDDSVLRAAARLHLPTPHEEDPPVDREQLIASLGLAPDATDAQITDTIAALKQRADQVDPLTQQIAALKQAGAGNPDPARFVPIDTVTTLRNEVAALTTRLHGRELDELMTAGLADGRILPAMESWARELGGRDIAALRSYLDTAQPIAALAGSQTGGRSRAANDTGLTDAELAVCRQMGLSPDEFKQARGGA